MQIACDFEMNEMVLHLMSYEILRFYWAIIDSDIFAIIIIF